jgi:hypothetical protein
LILVILALFIIGREGKMHHMNPGLTDWMMVLLFRLGIMLAITLKLAGLALCMDHGLVYAGYYLLEFRNKLLRAGLL